MKDGTPLRKNKLFSLESITRTRSGGTRHLINGIPTGTTYTICFGDQREMAKVETNKEWIFSEFTDKLWKAVGVRLLMKMLENMANGARYRFGETMVDDQGLVALSYLEVDNVHLLEAAIRMLWKKGGPKLSSLLAS